MSTGRSPLVRVPHDGGGPSPLALARIARGLRQRDLAALVGISRQYLSYAEHGRALPAHRQEQLAAVLGRDVAAIFPDGATGNGAPSGREVSAGEGVRTSSAPTAGSGK